MRHLVKPVYQFDELSDSAKDQAREWYRSGALDYDWWDATYDDAKTCLGLAGFTIEEIWFSGFSSQGNGACFRGSWSPSDTQPVRAMRSHAPKDKTLHSISVEMNKIKRSDPESGMSVRQRGHGNHSGCTAFSVNAKSEDLQQAIIDVSRQAMDWIYSQLEKEYEWLQSDKQVDESIRANEYEFDEDGRRA